MIGTLCNAAGIVMGGIVGLAKPGFRLSAANEGFIKTGLSALTVFFGLRLTWMSLNGSFGQVLKQLLIVVLAMMLGKLAGSLLRLQRTSNTIGHWARERMAARKPGSATRGDEGFRLCAALFCAAPLGILGAVQDGTTSPPYYYPLVIKGVMDGLAALSFASLFGWGVLLSAVPVVALQGTITLLCAHALGPWLSEHDLVNSVNAVGGLLVFSVALLMFGLKKIEVTDYLPSLAFAPLLTSILR